jgi:uncharacterized protein VirK/YbjX
MESSARLFNCARCQQPVLICTDCDRGNLYCGPICSGVSRRCSRQESSKRYQNSRRGRLKHAARQKRYQERKTLGAKKMTHQGIQDTMLNDSLVRANETTKPIVIGKFCCDFCEKSCSTFVRMDFLCSHSRVLANVLSASPNGP